MAGALSSQTASRGAVTSRCTPRESSPLGSPSTRKGTCPRCRWAAFASGHVISTSYRQRLELGRTARIRYRAGDEIAVDHLALRGAGARFTGQAVIDATYHLPPARRDPLARLALELRHVSLGGLPPTDARLDAT